MEKELHPRRVQMNTITPLNPGVKPDLLPESPKTDTPVQSPEKTMDPIDYPNYPMPAFEVEQPSSHPTPAAQSVTPSAVPATPASSGAGRAQIKSMTVIASSGFLMKYIASLFAGISVLSGLTSLSFILLDHFINKPEGLKLGSMFDASTIVSTWHVWLVASLLTFTTLYLLLSRAAGKYLAANNASDNEVQVGEVARSIFTAILIIFAAYLAASLLFTLLNSTIAAAEIEGKDIAIQVAGSVLAFIWITLIIKHQSVVHQQGKNGLAGIILAVVAAAIVIVASVFLLAAGRNAVIDSRTLSDLSTVQSELSTYNAKNDQYPESLSVLAIDDEKVKSRLSNYKYTRTQTTDESTAQDSYEDMFSSDDFYSSGSTSSFRTLQPATKNGYKLCANFLTDASSKSDLYGGSADLTEGASASASTSFYSHGKGEHCIERDI